jgi:hypothetical protein
MTNMSEVPTKEQAKVLYAFLKASEKCKGIKGSSSDRGNFRTLTNRSLCIKEKIKEIIQEIPEEELEKIHKEIYKKINREPEEANVAKALTRSLQ